MVDSDDEQDFNPNNEWVMVYSVSFDDSWIAANLPPTDFVIASPVNSSKFYIYRNVEPLPKDGYFWLDGGDGCVVTTDLFEPVDPPSGKVPAFPVPSSQLTHGEPQFVGVIS